MVNIKNPSSFWLDNCTFVLSFDGGTDEDGDKFVYNVEHHKDTGRFIFERLYEFDVMPAKFSPSQESYLKRAMYEMMCELN